MALLEFREFPKIPRLSRDCVITEKIDGTNASIFIPEVREEASVTTSSGRVMPFLCGSRTRWIFPENDNQGFARWAYEHEAELLQLGPGHHFGEWWGSGIQRGYGLPKGEKRFSLFNAGRFKDQHGTNDLPPYAGNDDRLILPACCYVVPLLLWGPFADDTIALGLDLLKAKGSYAAPGFDRPEGIVIYHEASRGLFKKTFEKDEGGKERG